MYSQDKKHTFRYKFGQKSSLYASQRFRTYKGLVDYQNYILKIVPCKDEKQLLFYKHILLKRIQLQRQLNWESVFYSKIVYQTVIQIDALTDKKQIFLYIFHPFFPTNNLCEYTAVSGLSTLQLLSLQQKSRRIEKIISQACLLLMRNTNQQLYSCRSLLFDRQQQKLRLNPISFVGMQMLMYDQSISQQDFLQIVQLLGSYTLQQGLKQRFTIQLKFRAIGILLLNMISEKQLKIMIDKKQLQIKGQQTQLQKYIELTKSLPKIFKILLQSKMYKGLIKTIESKSNVRYYEFLTKIFVEEKKLSWSEVIDLIIPKKYSQEITTQVTITAAAIAQSIYKLSFDRQPKRDILEMLGLKQREEMDLYFITLMADEKLSAYQLFKYKDINQFIYNPQSFGHSNMLIFKKILNIFAKIFQKRRYSECEIYFHKIFNNNIEKIEFNETFQLQPKQEPKLDNFQQFLYQLTRNFATFQTKDKNRKLLNSREEFKAIQAYSNVFK